MRKVTSKMKNILQNFNKRPNKSSALNTEFRRVDFVGIFNYLII